MKKQLKNILALTVLLTSFSSMGAEGSSTPPLQSILKGGPSYKPTQRPSKQRFFDSVSHYQQLHPEKMTALQRHNERLLAQRKKQTHERQKHLQTARNQILHQANEQWELPYEYNPQPYPTDGIIQDILEREAKLQATARIQEFERELTLQEQIKNAITLAEQLEIEKEIGVKEPTAREREQAKEDGKKVALFMRMATVDLPEFESHISGFFKIYPTEMRLIIDFIVNRLVDEGTITDKTEAVASRNISAQDLTLQNFLTKINVLDELKEFDAQCFQKLLGEYLEAHDYSFLTPPVMFSSSQSPVSSQTDLLPSAPATSFIEFSLDE
jgi:hypothetical protein